MIPRKGERIIRGTELSVIRRIVPRLLRGMAVRGEIVDPQRGSRVPRVLRARPSVADTARGRRLVIVLRLAGVETLHVRRLRDRLSPGGRLRQRTGGAEGIVRVDRRVVHVRAGGHAAALLLVRDLDVPEHGVRVHGVVLAEGALAAADDDVEDDGREVRDEREHGEGEQDLVDAADHDAGRGAPGVGGAGGQERAGHAPAEEAGGDGPEEEEEGVEDQGEEGRHAVVAAVDEGDEDEVDDSEEGSCC